MLPSVSPYSLFHLCREVLSLAKIIRGLKDMVRQGRPGDPPPRLGVGGAGYVTGQARRRLLSEGGGVVGIIRGYLSLVYREEERG